MGPCLTMLSCIGANKFREERMKSSIIETMNISFGEKIPTPTLLFLEVRLEKKSRELSRPQKEKIKTVLFFF